MQAVTLCDPTGSLNRTGTGKTHHWLARDLTGSLNRIGTGKILTGVIKGLNGDQDSCIVIGVVI